MAPPRKNQNHDDKSDTPHEGGGGGKKNGHTGGTKMRRGGSSTGSSLREVTNAAAVLAAGPTSHPATTATTTQSEASNPGVRWLLIPQPSPSRNPIFLIVIGFRPLNVPKLTFLLTLHSSNGPPSKETSSMPTDEPTVSRHRPHTRILSTNGSSPNPAALVYTRPRLRDARNIGGKARTS